LLLFFAGVFCIIFIPCTRDALAVREGTSVRMIDFSNYKRKEYKLLIIKLI